MKALELRKKALSQKQPTTQTPKPGQESSSPLPPPASTSTSPREPSTSSTYSTSSSLQATAPTRARSALVSSVGEMAAAVATESPPQSSSSSSSYSYSSITPSEPASLEHSVPDTPTQDSYTAAAEPATAEVTLPSPTQAPSTSTERDSQKSYSDDLDKESESSYAVSDINGDSVESTVVTDDGEDRLATRLHPPPPTLLLPTPKASPLETQPVKEKEAPRPEPLAKTFDEPKKDDTPPRSPLLHLNMLVPKVPADFMESQKLPKAHHRLPSDTPVIETARSVSAPFLNNQEKKQVTVASRKVSVASSVSQRIKALEMLNKPGSAQSPLTPQRSRPSSPTPQFPPLRANSLKSSASSPNLVPLSAPVGVPSIPQRLESPFLNKRNSDESGANGRSNGLPTLAGFPTSKVRTGSFGEVNVVPSRKASVSSLNISTIAEPETVASSKDSVSSAGTSPTGKGGKMPPLMRRMSSTKSDKKPSTPITSSPLSPMPSPVVRATPAVKTVPVVKTAPVMVAPPTPPPAAPVEPAKTTLLTGWVNVQLPDTMLWKRRYIKIESDTWLYLTISADEGSPLTSKYNIGTEVRAANVPDIDEQELPNSVNLRLIEGGVLACACENQQEQNKVLNVVRSCIA
ncbi:hypothetical protein DRE_02270 [Drechslerella stenobrocha 248]|uniref:PH domain-containing protein n=1 Tax=Drechslerella stenobrocha 248 TaxID=1043628 RepID=W7HVF5_9PEZI|nr:hypothetical protein DRE_02270 [Drechslerella stenobrocha 248]